MHDNKLFADQLEYFDQHITMSLISLFGLSFFMVNIFWENAGAVTALTWMAVHTAVILIRFFISSRYHTMRDGGAAMDYERWYRLFFAGVLLTAAVWSIGTFIFFVRGSTPDQAILALFYAGITSGAVLSLSVRKEFIFIYLILFLLPLAFLLSQEHQPLSMTLAAVVGLYGMFLFTVAAGYSQMINDGILIRYKNTGLIRELEAANAATENAARAKADFLATMSHEIRTPMTGILGFVEQLAKHESDPERLRQFAIINSSGKTLLGIINDILDVSKIETGSMTLERQPTDLHAMVDEMLVILDNTSEKRTIAFEDDSPGSSALCLLLDQLRFKQILFNLLNNAIKFTADDGHIRIRMRCDAGTLHCAVIDDGVGIAPENLEKIFKAFAQEDSTTTRRFGGTGLGLTISAKLVEIMGGQLKVESDLGTGSRFYFEIPIERCSAVQIAALQKQPANHRPDCTRFQAHVLIVEDQPFNQLLLGTILVDYGVTYDTAGDGEEAVQLFRQNVYDLILMDENMPNMNGIESTRQIRNYERQHGLSPTPIVAVTANVLPEERRRFIEVGMVDFISKPYVEADIAALLEKYLA